MDGATAVERAYEIVRTRILSGQYAPRQHLRESVLAADAGVSRTPVREALKRLIAEQFVTYIPNRGAFVTERPGAATEDDLPIRAMIEGYGAQLAAARISAAELQRLEALSSRIDDLRAANSDSKRAEAASLALEFHLLLCRASKNDTLSAVLRMLLTKPPLAKSISRYSASEWELARTYRRELIRALRTGDGPSAAHLVSALVLQPGRPMREGEREAPQTPARSPVSMLLP